MREMCKVGDAVFAVVKNFGTFNLEVVSAKVQRITADVICLHGQSKGFETPVWEFPLSCWSKGIFDTQEEAERWLDDFIEDQRRG